MSCRYEAYNSMMQSIHIYGDNIVECERTFALVLLALRPPISRNDRAEWVCLLS